MREKYQYILLGTIMAVFIGLLIPAFLLGPVLFDSLPLSAVSFTAKAWSLALFFFGTWLLVVTIFAKPSDLKSVLSPFEGSEAVVFFLPYMIYIGTKSVWRRLHD